MAAASRDAVATGDLCQHNKDVKMDTVIYGPVTSRRFQTSLGINILGPQKLCSFDCPYCDLGVSVLRLNQIKKGEVQLPTALEVEDQLREALKALKAKNQQIQTIAFSGNGEPSLHPDFPDIVSAVMKMKQEMSLDVKVLILSNGVHLDSKRNIAAFNELDERVIKLDAGSDRLFKTINAPLVRSDLTKIYSNLRKLTDVTIQSFFVTGAVDNTKAEDIEDWIEILGIIQPKMVQICGINRPPVNSQVQAVDEDTLYTIASKLKRRTQLESAVYL